MNALREKSGVLFRNVLNYANYTKSIFSYGIKATFKSLMTMTRKLLSNVRVYDKRTDVFLCTEDTVYTMAVPNKPEKAVNHLAKRVYGVTIGVDGDVNGKRVDITQLPGTPYVYKPEDLGFDHFIVVDDIQCSETIHKEPLGYLDD